MKYRWLLAAVPILLSLSVSPMSQAASTLTAPTQVAGGVTLHYTVTELGPISAVAINNSGQVVASSGDRAFLISQGRMTDIGAFYPNAMNDLGQVVGVATIQGSRHAVLYTNGQLTDLGLGIAYAINNRGQVVGQRPVDGSGPPFESFLYSDGVMKPIPGLATSLAINNRGEIAGTSLGQAAVYNGGHLLRLGVLPASQPASGATAINDLGQVAGWSGSDTLEHAFLYTHGTMVDLGTLNGGDSSTARAMNNGGQVVGAWGTIVTQRWFRAFLYGDGMMVDLGTLFSDSAQGIPLDSTALAINDRGQIVVVVTPRSICNPTLCPPPSAYPPTRSLLLTP